MAGSHKSAAEEGGARAPRARAALITDVAKAAGVSTATVSRVVNSPDLVSAATAERVREAMDELSYRPNMFAKGLITRSSRVLGVMLPDFHGDFYSQLLHAADSAAREAGYHLVVSSDTRAGSADAAQSLPAHLLDGVIALIPFPDASLLRSVIRAHHAVVLIDSGQPVERVDSIGIDNASGARAATEHLITSTPGSDCFHVAGPRTNYDTMERASAFEDVVRSSGIPLRSDQIEYGSFSPEWGYAWGMRMLASRHGTRTAVFAGNDEIAIGVMQAANTLGLSLPGDIRLVGFDGSRLASMMRPALSTVSVPLREIGELAVTLCLGRIEDPSRGVLRSLLPTELVIRETS